MATDDRYDETVKRVAAEVLGVPVDRLRGEPSLTDLKASPSDNG